MDDGVLVEFDCVGVGYHIRHGFRRNQRVWALEDVTFALRQGETLGVIGRNGAGKSTLLRLLGGIIEPDQGVIRKRRGLNVLLLSLQVGFMPHLSGRENAVISGMLLGMRRRSVERAMPDIIEFSGLREHIDRPVYTYSTGMKARLGFAVAQQTDPDVLLIDEALGVGDEEFRRKSLEAMLLKIQSSKTLVLVSHSAATIETYCDRVIWIEGGRIRAQGPAKKILEEYLGTTANAVKELV